MLLTTADKENSPRMAVRSTALALAVIALALWVRETASSTDTSPPKIRLANAELSREALIEKFVAGLSANDRAAIERLRVDAHEYRTLILPGSVKPGQRPQIMPDDASEYFWGLNDTKSRYRLNAMLKAHGGRPYKIERIVLERVDRFAWYVAHRDPVLYLRTPEGFVFDLQLGTIAEHNGRYKFISYNSD